MITLSASSFLHRCAKTRRAASSNSRTQRRQRAFSVVKAQSSDDVEEMTFTQKFESFFQEKEESIEEKEKRLNNERKKELEMKNRVYDRDGTYVSEEGSDFFKDPEQLKAVAIFCAFLASFLSLGNIGAAFLLPIIYGKPLQSCIGGIVFGLPCPGIDF